MNTPIFGPPPDDPRIREAFERLSAEARAIVDQYSAAVTAKAGETGMDEFRRLYGDWAK